MSKLEEIDGTEINQLFTPDEIAKVALESCDAGDLMSFVRQNFNDAARDYVNESLLAKHLSPRFTAKSLWSEIAHEINQNPDSERFREIAFDMITGHAATAKHSPDLAAANAATEIGRALARMVSEKALADVLDNARVAAVEQEGDKIDVVCDSGNIQVQTCFAASDATTGKTAKAKFGGDGIPKNVDHYVVLHFDTRTDKKKFGVGVNDLSNGIRREGTHENTVAKNAQK